MLLPQVRTESCDADPIDKNGETSLHKAYAWFYHNVDQEVGAKVTSLTLSTVAKGVLLTT